MSGDAVFIICSIVVIAVFTGYMIWSAGKTTKLWRELEKQIKEREDKEREDKER